MAIELRWLGHACFQVTYEDYSIVLIPLNPAACRAVPILTYRRDEVLCSHGHHDHNYTARCAALGKKESPSGYGDFHLPRRSEGASAEKIKFILEAGGIKVVHLGISAVS